MTQHIGIGGCQGTEGEIAHKTSISNNTVCVNSITTSYF